MSSESRPPNPPQSHGEVTVMLPDPGSGVGDLGAAPAKSAIFFSTYAVELRSESAVRTAALDLIERRRWFACISLPGDIWVISVKAIDQDVLEAIIQHRGIEWFVPRPELMRFGA